MRLVSLFGSLPGGGLGFVLNALFSVISLVLLVAGVWFLLRRRARETDRDGRLAQTVAAYERADETNSDDREE